MAVFCITSSNPEFQKLLAESGQKPLVFEMMVSKWMTNNEVYDRYPTLEELGIFQSTPQIKPGVEELFNSNPELASVGTPEQYSQYLDNIFPNSKVKDIVYRGDKSKTINGVTQFLKGERKDLLFLSTNKEVAKNTLYYSDFSDFIYKKDEFGNLTLTSEYEPDESKGLVRGPKNFIAAVVNVKNPLIKNANNQSYRDYKIDGKNEYETIKEAKEKIKNKEVDSLIVENVLEGDVGKLLSTNIGIKEPEQIHILGSKQDIKGFKEFVGNVEDKASESGLSLSSDEAAAYNSLINDGTIPIKCE
jgi:hypothetical protein